MIIPYIINQNQVNAKSSWLLQTISADNHMGWTNDDVENFADFLTTSIEYASKKRSISYNTNEQTRLSNAFVNLNSNNEVVLTINDATYTLHEEDDGDIYILNSQGDKLKLIDFEDYSFSNSTTRAANGAFTWKDDVDFTNDIGPYTKTGKYFIDTLTFISDITGYLVEHPILGQIYIASSLANIVLSQNGYMTSYIKYWQAFNKYDSTYIREKQEWYHNSSYSSSSYIKNNVRYFYSSRP